MPRNRSRSETQRRRAASASTPPTPSADPQDSRPLPGAAPPPWSVRGMATLVMLVALLQVPLALVDWLRDRRFPFGAYLVNELDPPAIPVLLFVSFLLVMPFARRLAGEERNMRVLETLSAAAICLILLVGMWSPVLAVHGGALDPFDAKQVLGGAAADAGALALTAVGYPAIHRRLWTGRRRLRR